MNAKQWIGLGTMAAILGISVASYIVYRKQKKSEEEGISLEEAREMVDKELASSEELRRSINKATDWTPSPSDDYQEQMEELSEEDVPGNDISSKPEDYETLNVMDLKTGRIVESYAITDDEDLEETLEELENEESIVEEEPVLLEDEGVGRLRYDPNSDEALMQFMKMELAEWGPNDQEMKDSFFWLFEVPFAPMNEGDEGLYNRLVHNRESFFGPASKWCERVSFADMVLYFAKLTDYNIGGSIKQWANLFISYVGLHEVHESTDIEEIVVTLLEHDTSMVHEGLYGIFGLSSTQLQNALKVASRKPVDELTFDIEFQEFLKQYN